MVSRELEKECVVVFDEAHNIDNVCIEVRIHQMEGHCGNEHAYIQRCSAACFSLCWPTLSMSALRRR